MANDWKSFIVTPYYVTDLNGVEYVFFLPPSWKTELLIWDILESSSGFEISDITSALAAVDSLSKIVALLLNFPPSKKVEELFDGETIENAFITTWHSILDSTIPGTEGKPLPASSPKKEEFNLAQALAMFACECGWTPDQVLSLPKVQVVQLTQAISEYAGHRMKFQAAIHGCPLETGNDSASYAPDAQIDIEKQISQFQEHGLPIEVI